MRALFLAFILLLSIVGVLCAQSMNASLSGRVSDAANARIAAAKVAAISVGTNIRYETATNATGEYSLASLPPDTYGIEVEKAGFKKLIKPDVILHVQDALDIDFEMTVGAATESVTVEGGAPPVDRQ